MIFFLFFHFFPLIRGDCLEFPTNNQSINECLIKQNENHDSDVEHYYHECLRCTIRTTIKSENIQYEEDNKCSTISLQCIQLIFNTKEIFEDFFQFHQQFIYDLFTKENGTDRNTLHIIIKENKFNEINSDYIERIFQINYQSYRALFFELHHQNENIKINRNLINITRLAIKLILVCSDDEIKPLQTIYVIHNGKVIVESEDDSCSIIFIPSASTTTFKSTIQTSSSILLSISQEKSKDIVLIIVILTGLLLCLLIMFIIFCLKWIRRRRRRLSKKHETSNELSMSQDISIETPLTPQQKPKLSLKPKRPLRGMRAIQLLDDDI